MKDTILEIGTKRVKYIPTQRLTMKASGTKCATDFLKWEATIFYETKKDKHDLSQPLKVALPGPAKLEASLMEKFHVHIYGIYLFARYRKNQEPQMMLKTI